MIVLANIAVNYAALFLAGAALCYFFLLWKEKNARKLQSLEAQSVLEKARRDADALVRDARLAANEEALKIRSDTEKSFDSRRSEQSETERRLGERETMINAQLEKLMLSEKNLDSQKAYLQKQSESVAANQTELTRLNQERR